MFQRRQQKITAAFDKQKSRAEVHSDEDDNGEVLIEDNRKLRAKLLQLEAYMFKLQRSRLPQPRHLQPHNMVALSEEISSHKGEVVLHNKRAKIKQRHGFYLRHFGIQVRYISDDLCIIKYDVTLDQVSSAQYVVQFAKLQDTDDWVLTKYHLPLRFCMDAMSQFEPMSTTYLRNLQVALHAHHDRQAQIEKFKEMKPSNVHIFHSLNGSDIEIAFRLVAKDRNSETIEVALVLKYDPFQGRPTDLEISQNVVIDLSEETVEILMKQFDSLKTQRLWESFAAAVSREGPHPYFCPDDDCEEDDEDMRGDQLHHGKNRRHPVQSNHRNDDTSEDDYLPPPRPNKKNGNPPKQQKKQYDALSDSSGSFKALEEVLRKKKSMTSAKKPSKKSKTQSCKEPELQYVENENDEYVTEVLRDKNVKSNKTKAASKAVPVVSKPSPKKRSYQITTNDVTANSYLYVPETKAKKSAKKTTKSPAKKAKKTVQKENSMSKRKKPIPVKRMDL